MKGAMMRVPTRGKTAAAKPSSSYFSQPARPFSTPPVEERTLADLDAWEESAGRLGHGLDNLHVGGNAEGPGPAAGAAPIQRMPKKHHPINPHRTGKKSIARRENANLSQAIRKTMTAQENRANRPPKKGPRTR